MALFFRFIVRPLGREPLRTALTLFAVALGVAVVLAIDLAGEAATGSFRSSVETLAGDADLEVTALGGLDERQLGTLATLPYPLRVKPRLEDYATLAETQEVVPLIGLDLVADALESLAEADSGREAFRQEESVWVSEGLGLAPGSSIRIQVQDRTHELVVGGVFRQPGRVLVSDIPLAQRLLGRRGKLDRILIWTPESVPLEEWRQRVAAHLPGNVTVNPHGAKTRENQRMLGAFRWNLRVLSYIALVVGAFLIYNTISVSVVRRRAEIGILRAVGATRRWVLMAFLGEAALFGLLGGLAGLLLGRGMAEGAVQLVGATVESLYVSSRPGEIRFTPGSALLALLTAVVVAVLSALSPAREAAAVAPVDAMGRGRSDYLSRVSRFRNFALALLCAGLAAAAAQLPPFSGKPVGGYAAAILLIGGAALAMPAMADVLLQAAAVVLGRLLGVEALLAARSLAGSLRRTAVLTGALATAVAMMVSVGIMVGSFRQTVLIWMDNQLKGDLYLRPAGPASADRFPTLTNGLDDRIARLPEVAAIDRFRAYPISYNGLPATLASSESAVTAGDDRPPFLSGGNRREILRRLPTCDCVVVSEPFANKHGVRVGDQLRLPIGEFTVLGVYSDYANERGYILMDRATMLRYLPDPAPSNLAVWVKPGVSLERARRAIEQAAAGSNVAVFSNRSLRAEAIKIFDRTFAITYALEGVAIAVAVMGIAGALLALVIDRRRELSLLRFLGGSQGQIRRIVLSEAGLLGLLSQAAGLVLGVLLSLILVFVINKQSFGWTIQFHWPVGMLVAALAGVYVATLLAGLYPAQLAVRLNPIEVIHEE